MIWRYRFWTKPRGALPLYEFVVGRNLAATEAEARKIATYNFRRNSWHTEYEIEAVDAAI